MTEELSFKKKFLRFFSIKAVIEAYAIAVKVLKFQLE